MIENLIVGLDVAQFFENRDATVNQVNKKLARFDREACKSQVLDLDEYSRGIVKIVNSVVSKRSPGAAKLLKAQVDVDISETGVTSTVLLGLDPRVYSLYSSNSGIAKYQ